MIRFILIASLLVAGCEKYQSANDVTVNDSSAESSTRSPSSPLSSSKTGESTSSSEPATATSGRKIIYTANVDLVVEDFANTPQELKRLVAKHGGMIASSNLYAVSGSQQSGNWRIRVPVANFDAFLDEIRTLGEVVSISTDSEEVTDQYFDLEKRIENKAVERDRLQKILADEKQTGKLKDVLDVEKRLSEVQGEIELAQGHMRRLKDRIAMTTVTLSIRQIRDYVAPEAATFGTLARRAFESSWLALQRTAQAAALIAIALAPWLPLIIIAIFLVRFGWKRLRRARK